MKLENLGATPDSTKKRKRVGRGRSSGHGKTCGRGMKGQKARGKTRPGFEGGQMPLQRRVPKLRGFKPINRTDYHVINVEQLNSFESGANITPDALVEAGMIRKLKNPIKILGRGEVEKELTVNAHCFSAAAKEKIENAGGKAISL